jgi:predicted metal-dependent hydrolase
MSAPRKREVGEIGRLIEPMLNSEQKGWLEKGILLFNSGEPWHAHEEWERLWLTMPEGRSGDAEIVLRGLIQLAAAIHLLKPGREEGSLSNFRKAREKLALAPQIFLGIKIQPLISYIDQQLQHLDPTSTCTIERQ